MTPTLKKVVIGACVVAAALVLWFSWMFRYEPMGTGTAAVWLWDRWGHTVCFTAFNRGQPGYDVSPGAQVVACSAHEMSGQ